MYFKDYYKVLTGKKTLEGIKGSSSLKSALVWFLTKTTFTFIDDDSCTVLVGKPGVFIDYRNIVSNDIAIFDQSVLPGARISKKYADVPPKIAIEVDISIDLSELTETGYIYKKTRKLLEFGVEKVIWVLTEAQVVLVTTKERIETFDWDKNIELMDGQEFNIGSYLVKKGIVVE